MSESHGFAKGVWARFSVVAFHNLSADDENQRNHKQPPEPPQIPGGTRGNKKGRDRGRCRDGRLQKIRDQLAVGPGAGPHDDEDKQRAEQEGNGGGEASELAGG